ncbi:MAG: dodecin family protein [Draconibacterium sp.]
MGVLKVIEVLSSSKTSWEDAAQDAVKSASKSLKGIRSVNVSNMSAVVEKDTIVEYRLNVKITFEVKD